MSEDILRHFGHTERPEGKLGQSALYSTPSDHTYIDTGENSGYNEGASYGGTFTDPKINAVLVFDSTDATVDSIQKDYFRDILKESNNELRRNILQSAENQSFIRAYSARDYSATSKIQMGINEAKIPDVFHSFGYTGNYIIRDGVYYKDEGSISGDTEVSYSQEAKKKLPML